MRVRRMRKKSMTLVGMARMKKSRQPMPKCRLIGLLKARERYVCHNFYFITDLEVIHLATAKTQPLGAR